MPDTPITPGAAIIEVTGLRTQFGTAVIHDDLDFSVEDGEIMAIVGGSGTGKSVLLRTIVGLNRPAAGRIRVLGHDVSGLSEHDAAKLEARWGVSFQDGALFSSLTVAQNIELAIKEHTQLSVQLRRELAEIKISMVGLRPDAANGGARSDRCGCLRRPHPRVAAFAGPDCGPGHPRPGQPLRHSRSHFCPDRQAC